MTAPDPTVLVRHPHELAECPRWIGDRLVFVDILAGSLWELAVAAAPTVTAPRLLVDLDLPLGAVAPVRDEPHTWIAAVGDGIGFIRTGRDDVDWLARPEANRSPRMRMNDGVCDASGRFWAGSMAYDGARGAGSLYRVDADGSVHRVMEGLTIVNGPAFSADGTTLYVADTAAGDIWTCPVDVDTGSLGPRTRFTAVDPADGSPDGMTVDRDGHLWVAMWGGARLVRYSPDGRVARVQEVPVAQPTAPCLVGHGENARLVITSASHGLTGDRPVDGSLLCVEGVLGGKEAVAYAGGSNFL